jgi:hypothetical protein
MLNPSIRVVLRQFNPILGAKIEQNLPNSTALSAAAHSAATYAGAALDEACFFGLRFPAQTGPLLGFSRATGAVLGIGGLTVIEAERVLGARILAVGDRNDPPAMAAIDPADEVVTFGHVVDRDRRERFVPESSFAGAAIVPSCACSCSRRTSANRRPGEAAGRRLYAAVRLAQRGARVHPRFRRDAAERQPSLRRAPRSVSHLGYST